MQLCLQMFLFCFAILVGMEECSTFEKWSLLTIFDHCGLFPEDLGQVHEQITVFCENCETIFYIYVPNHFYFVLFSRSAGRSAQTYVECSILSLFSHLGTFLHFLGHVKE